MKAAEVLKRGDLVFFNYGAQIGDDFGTVVAIEQTAFGAFAWVRKSDFTLTGVTNLSGEIIGTIRTDFFGCEYISARGVKGIGAYRVQNLAQIPNRIG